VAIRRRIEAVFGERAFARPLFYQYPGGLRFELSTGDMTISRFVSALHTATKICASIFEAEETLIVCLRVTPEASRFAHRQVLAQLRGANVIIPLDREFWLDSAPFEQQCIAFEVPRSMLESLLWCALARDFGAIRPRPFCSVYFFDVRKGVMVLPYDDRGMDVVGPNATLLSRLYAEHGQHLLDNDRRVMDATFATWAEAPRGAAPGSA
jgi:hypothetical protein